MQERFLLVRENERGTALVIALLATVVLVLLGIAAIRTVTTDIMISANDKAAKQAFYLAEAGLEEALARMKSDNIIDNYGNVISASDISECQAPLSQPQGTQSTGTYIVTIARISSNTIRVASTGTTTNGKGIKEMFVNVNETAAYPEIYNFSLFSLQNIDLGGNVETLNGDIYSGENITISSAPAVTNGDVLAWRNVTFPNGNNNIENGSVRANGAIVLGNQQNILTEGDAIANRTVSGNGTVAGGIYQNGEMDPNVHPPTYYEESYKATESQFSDYRTKAEEADQYFSGDRTITGGEYTGIVYIDGALDIHGDFTGKATFVVTGDLTMSGNINNTGGENYAFVVDGDVGVSGNSTVDGIIYSNGDFYSGGNTTINGSVISFGTNGITGIGNVFVNYVPPDFSQSQNLPGPPQYFYNIESWQG